MAEHPIPDDVAQMPDTLGYDPEQRQLLVGSGRIANVSQRMRDYKVSEVNILNKWFSYRRKSRERPQIGERRLSPLLQIQSDAWRAEYTSELIDLLNVLGLLVDIEPEQADLLGRIIDGPVISADDLAEAGVLPVAKEARKPPKIVGNLNAKTDDMLL